MRIKLNKNIFCGTHLIHQISRSVFDYHGIIYDFIVIKNTYSE